MKSKTDILFMVFSEPRQAMRLILDEPPVGFILLIFLFTMANMHIASAAQNVSIIHSLGVYFTFGFFVKVVGVLIFLFVLVSIIHFISDLMGSTASAGGLYVLFMLSLVPFIFTAPAVLLTKTTYSIIHFFLIVWAMVLHVLAVQVLYRISAGKAFFIYVLPYVFLIVLFPLFMVIYLMVSILVLM